MSNFLSMTIKEAISNIQANKFLLPAFQREYTWKPEQIERLFDSLMRGYPTSSMLFWQVEKETKNKWSFYQFLQYYREEFHTHNEEINKCDSDFYAVLDGQQRLTSIYLALCGHYDIHMQRKAWKDEDDKFKICDFYFNLTATKESKNADVEYEFLWLDKETTEQKPIYDEIYYEICENKKIEKKQKWFKCSHLFLIINFKKFDMNDLDNFIDSYKYFTNEEKNRLRKFCRLIMETPDESKINYYLIKDKNLDIATDIFIRINSGGTKLEYSDILFSYAISNWQTKNARTEIIGLVDHINQDLDTEFKISKDFILKTFLFLYHNEIKFSIKSFDNGFITNKIENNWKKIKPSIITAFKLLKSFGLNAKTLHSDNAVMPIVYFIYHKQFEENFVLDSIHFKDNRKLIKKYILRSIILKPFSSSADTVLTNIRKVFIEKFDMTEESFFDNEEMDFPLEQIEKSYRYGQNIDDEFLNELMKYRKDSSEAFAVLSLLYPNLDTRNNFHKDHLHPKDSYKKYEKLMKDKNLEPFDFKIYDSLANLQLLDANENDSKQDKSLQEWVDKNCGDDKEKFLKDHLIPNVDLNLENFNEFYEKRKEILINKLKEIL